MEARGAMSAFAGAACPLVLLALLLPPLQGCASKAAQAPRDEIGYPVKGKSYIPHQRAAGFTQRGLAAWYGRKGARTSSGERLDPEAFTCAHTTLPFNTRVEVTNLRNGRKVVVRVNDRGPFGGGRVIDLSRAAARSLGMLSSGTAPVSIRALPR